MVTTNNTHRKVSRVLGITLTVFFVMSSFLNSQTVSNQRAELPEYAVKNILIGIESENDGLKMSCIYFAGKYKIFEASQSLVEEIKSSNDDELSKMLAWSLYQIGNDSCWEELQTFVKNHPSKKLRDFCSNLHKIRAYEIAIAKS